MTIKEGNGTATTRAGGLARVGPDYSLLEILRAAL
jgi:hypothetical protein